MYLKDLQRLQYEMMDTARPFSLIATAALYSLGFGIVVLPSLQTLWHITANLIAFR